MRWDPVDDVIASLTAPLNPVSAVEPLVVHQQALADIEAHAAASRAFAFGVLYGEVYRCPRLQMNYVLVEGVQRGSLDDAPPNADLRSTLDALIRRLRDSGVRAVGWYRTGAAAGLHLSPSDTSMHAALFPDPWAIAFVRDALIVGATGIFVRLVDGTKPYAVPFFEQLSADAFGDGSHPKTVIAWSSYHTMTDVLRPEQIEAPLRLFDARRIRRAPEGQQGAKQRAQTARIRLFDPMRPVSRASAPEPAAEPAPDRVVEPPAPEPAPESIDRIFDPAPDASPRVDPPATPRRSPFRLFSFRPRLRLLALTIGAISLAIFAAWYATH